MDSSGEQYSTKMAQSDKNGLIYFIVGLILALIIWGTQLIGVTVNIWLGAFVLAIAFVLIAYAFWIWERTSNWHVLLRVGTIVIAAGLYFLLAGKQVMVEWKNEHSVRSSKSPEPIPQPFSTPESAPPLQSETLTFTIKPKRPTPAIHTKPVPKALPEVQPHLAPNQNCPNGICVGGDNIGQATVNNYAPLERHLTPTQIELLDVFATSLPDDTSEWLFIETINVPESSNLALEIERVFHGRNKTKSVVTRLVENTPVPHGVFVIISSLESEHFGAAQQIANILASSGFTVRFEPATGLSSRQVKVVVESN